MVLEVLTFSLLLVCYCVLSKEDLLAHSTFTRGQVLRTRQCSYGHYSTLSISSIPALRDLERPCAHVVNDIAGEPGAMDMDTGPA